MDELSPIPQTYSERPFKGAFEITYCTPDLEPAWDEYVKGHPDGTHCHLTAWGRIIKETYNHAGYYLLARTGSKVVGVLPLVYLKGLMARGSLISMPFLDMGGVLGDSPEVEDQLLLKAISLANSLKTGVLELRHYELPGWTRQMNQAELISSKGFCEGEGNPSYFIRQHKVRMLLPLPQEAETLTASFKSKLRSQIRKPIKEGCDAVIGGSELVDQFYQVFAVNMRDLGSPVHTKRLFVKVLEEFPHETRVFLVRKDGLAIAGSLVIGFRDTLFNPWASSLQRYGRMSPNMLLYWTMLEYACSNGFACFDFGRSSPDEGTFRFKEQWGALPHILNWGYISLNGRSIGDTTREKSRFQWASACWMRLPVPLTTIMGPKLRKGIGL
jgi:serine/alanine adding enzyme